MKTKSNLPLFLLLVLILGVVLGAFLIIKHSQNSIENGTSGKITNGMVLKTYHQIAIDNGNITIGKANSTGLMKPEVTLSKLGGEASMNISYPIGPNIKAEAQDNKITWNDTNQDLYFKQASSDKFEFDILLKEKPSSNVFIYHINATGLDFFYQPPLTQTNKDPNLTCSETECREKNGNLIDSRSENIVGSYAAYYKGGKSGDYSKAGGKNYQTGKAFHIYRPQITDAKGQKTWGQLAVNPDNGTLTVTVDPTFLATASYPVTIDPTLGYTTAGGSYTSISNTIVGSYYTMSEAGTPTSMSFYLSIGSCLTANTPITMVDGSLKEIKKIQIGDKVLSYNETTKTIEQDTVTKLFYYTADQMGEYYLTITTDDGKKIEVTPDHLIYVQGQWKEAGNLRVGDMLLNSQKQNIQIVSIEKVYNQVPVYNLEVKNNHDFFANFLVHNSPVGAKMKGAIYKQSDSSFVVGNNEAVVSAGLGWLTNSFTSAPALTASTNYWLFNWGNIGTLGTAYMRLYYDSGGNGGSKALTYVAGNGSAGWPAPISGITTNSNLYSIYVTYTAAATPTPTPSPTPTPIPTPTPAIKIGPGVKIGSGTCIRGGSNPCPTPVPIPITVSKFYLHDATSSDTGTLPSSKVSAYSVGGTDATANTNRSMDATIGTSQKSSSMVTCSPVYTNFLRRFVSAPIAAQTFSGTFSFSIGESTGSSGKIPLAQVYLAIWRPSTGAKVADLGTGSVSGTAGTSEQALSLGSLTLASVSSLAGDILIVEFYGKDNSGMVITAGEDYYDGTTEGSSTTNAAYISFSSPITLQ